MFVADALSDLFTESALFKGSSWNRESRWHTLMHSLHKRDRVALVVDISATRLVTDSDKASFTRWLQGGGRVVVAGSGALHMLAALSGRSFRMPSCGSQPASFKITSVGITQPGSQWLAASDLPSTLPAFEETRCIDGYSSELPEGIHSVYGWPDTSSTLASVLHVQSGKGSIVYLGLPINGDPVGAEWSKVVSVVTQATFTAPVPLVTRSQQAVISDPQYLPSRVSPLLFPEAESWPMVTWSQMWSRLSTLQQIVVLHSSRWPSITPVQQALMSQWLKDGGDLIFINALNAKTLISALTQVSLSQRSTVKSSAKFNPDLVGEAVWSEMPVSLPVQKNAVFSSSIPQGRVYELYDAGDNSVSAGYLKSGNGRIVLIGNDVTSSQWSSMLRSFLQEGAKRHLTGAYRATVVCVIPLYRV